MILDATVLVDLQRELRRDADGPGSQLLSSLHMKEVCIAFVTSMEFAEGFSDDHRDRSDRFLAPFRVLWPDADTVWWQVESPAP